MVHKKVALKNIKTLTFHADAQTASRRVSPIQQLTCVGRACDLFQPQVVQCSNMGDDGLGNVQWKCSTDLPSGLRLGKTDVSCEGWSKAGDANVLQGSCGLEYDLHRTDQNLMYEGHGMPKHNTIERYIDKAFSALFFVVTFILLYTIVRSVLLSVAPRFAPPPVSSFFPWGGGGGGGGGPGFGGGGGGHHHHHSHPPPPYTKIPEEARQTQPGATAAPTTTGPGFLGGLAGGVAAGYLASSLANRNTAGPSTYRGTTQRRFDDDDDRGVGPSNSGDSGLGEMRRATGFGSSSTR